MRNVYVLGTGMIKFGRYPDKTVPQLGGAGGDPRAQGRRNFN